MNDGKQEKLEPLVPELPSENNYLGLQGYFYMGFYDLNLERYEMYVGLDSEKKSAYDGAYEKETVNVCQTRSYQIYPEFGLRVMCCMPFKAQEFKALGIKEPNTIQGKCIMLYCITDFEGISSKNYQVSPVKVCRQISC